MRFTQNILQSLGFTILLFITKTEYHHQQQASNNKALAKSEQRIEHLTAYGSIQRPNTQQHAKPLLIWHW